MVSLESTELSDTGRKRQHNEDACLRLPGQGVFCVADGMGGVLGGDLASEAITTQLHEVFTKAEPADQGSLSGRIALFQKALNQASQWIKRFADEKGIRQMGSTVVGLVFDPCDPCRATSLHAGDSRLYRYRAGALKVLTSDHTAVATLAAKLGRACASLPMKFQNELVRAVGLSETVELEQTPVAVSSGDLFLLCSDGLSRMLPDSTIATILREHALEPLDVLAKALVSAANAAGGRDNVTVVLVKSAELAGPAAPLQGEAAEAETIEQRNDSSSTENTVSAEAFNDYPDTRETLGDEHKDTLPTVQSSSDVSQDRPTQVTATQPGPGPSLQGGAGSKIRMITMVLLPALILLSGAVWFKARRTEKPPTKIGQTGVSATKTRAQNGHVADPLLGTTRSERKKGPGMWTNALGMAFVEVPDKHFWVGTARITAAQYKTVMGALPNNVSLGEDDGLTSEAKTTYPEAKSFVEQLNQGLSTEGIFPEGYQTGRFALPTTNQWAAAVNASKSSDLRIQNLDDHSEWCSDDVDDHGSIASFLADLNRPQFLKPLDHQNSRVSLRLVLVP